MRIAHIYATSAKKNSGDFMIGIATKRYFLEEVLKTSDNAEFVDINCRKAENFTEAKVKELNNFDYLIIGAGGLILPDSSPNKISGWQLHLHKSLYNLIQKPIYVISIGYNLFYNQNINMPHKNTNLQEKFRTKLFTENILTLINQAKHFTLRHKHDVLHLQRLIGHCEVSYEMCPTVWYARKYWEKSQGDMVAIEVKDDRKWRRYHKVGKENFYHQLSIFAVKALQMGKKVCYLSHDGSRDFYNYLIAKGIKIPYLDNSVADEELIRQNYAKIGVLLCSAGHSQMIGYGNGIKIISMVSHPKLHNFCYDVDNTDYVLINKEKVGDISKKLLDLSFNT